MTLMLEWVERVARLVMGDAIGPLKQTEPFRHVVFEAVNEAWHPASSLRDEAKVNRLMQRIREIAHGYMVTTDDNFSRPEDVRYNPAYQSSFADCHPWRWRPTSSTAQRSIEAAESLSSYARDLPSGFEATQGWERFVPTREDYREMVRRNGRILVSEPICYDEFDESPGCSTDRRLLVDQRRGCEDAGAVWTFHSRRGLTIDAPLPWMP